MVKAKRKALVWGCVMLVVGVVSGTGVFLQLTRTPGTTDQEAVGTPPETPARSWMQLLHRRTDHEVDDALIDAALRYVQALQQGDVDEVVRRTAWMQERLHQLTQTGAPASEFEELEASFATRLTDRSMEGNQLRDAGVRDQYLFAPGVELEVTGNDAGATDLTHPVAQRTWFRVTYPNKAHALLDMAGQPIRSLVVGLNVDMNGTIIKAGVLGNAELRLQSIQYTWPSDQGG